VKRRKPKGPEPFWRASKQAWYVQLRDGSQRSLGRDEEEAWKEFHRVMLHEEGAAPRKKSYTVGEIFDLYLEYCLHETASYGLYRYFLNDASASFGRLDDAELAPFHVNAWLAKHTSWGPTTKNMVVAVVKAAFNHAVAEGRIDRNPVAAIRMPTPEVCDRVLTQEERRQIFGAVTDRCFADYLLALAESGARPGEVAKLTPGDVNLELGVWDLSRHKTRKKTARARVVYLTPALLDLTRRLPFAAAPGQPLFRNRNGNPWNRNNVYYRIETLRKKFPHLADVVPYTFRATFATDALERGVPEATVSELFGHTDTRMLHRHYNKISQRVKHLQEAAWKATQPQAQ
jgi:integrase